MAIRTISKGIFRRVLRSLGFVEDRGRDHIYLEYYYRGRKILETKVSHGGGRDISRRLLGYILREQIYLTKQEFESAVNGDISAEDYRKLLVEKGILPEE
jgi:hypothetical protein